MTASSVTDIYYLLNKHLHNADQAKQVLLKLFRLFEILDVTGSDCEKALSMPMTGIWLENKIVLGRKSGEVTRKKFLRTEPNQGGKTRAKANKIVSRPKIGIAKLGS